MKAFRIISTAALVTCALVVATLSPAVAQSSDAKTAAGEIGVTADEIHIAVLADVDNAFAPGLFQGSVDGVKGAAAYLNSKAGGGGVAGRKLVVDFIDTHVNANDSRNGTISACQNDLAMVGGAMVFLSNADDIVSCKDKAGQATGLPDMGAVVTGHDRGVRADVVPGHRRRTRLRHEGPGPSDLSGGFRATRSGCSPSTRGTCTGRSCSATTRRTLPAVAR